MGIALIVIAVIVILLIVFVIAAYNGMIRAATRSTRPGAGSTSSSSAGTT